MIFAVTICLFFFYNSNCIYISIPIRQMCVLYLRKDRSFKLIGHIDTASLHPHSGRHICSAMSSHIQKPNPDLTFSQSPFDANVKTCLQEKVDVDQSDGNSDHYAS